MQYVTPEEIHAARPDVPPHTIRRHIRAGAPWFPGALQIGRSWVVPLDEAEAYVEKYVRYERQK